MEGAAKRGISSNFLVTVAFSEILADFAPMLFPIIEGNDLRKSFDRLKERKSKGLEV